MLTLQIKQYYTFQFFFHYEHKRSSHIVVCKRLKCQKLSKIPNFKQAVSSSKAIFTFFRIKRAQEGKMFNTSSHVSNN